MAHGKRAPIIVNHIYAGPDGLAHWEKVEMKLMASTAIPGMEQSEPFNGASVSFVRRPPQVIQDSHPGGQPQYAVTISGREELKRPAARKSCSDRGASCLSTTWAAKTTRPAPSDPKTGL